MIPLPDQETFDTLLPFSFAVREDGSVIRVGKGLTKALPTLREGSIYNEILQSQAPFETLDRSPKRLIGHGVLLRSPLSPSLMLRGQVIEVPGEGETYLFATELGVRSARELRALGLDLGDFRLGEPVIDYLMLHQNQEISSKKLEESNARLNTENQISRALLLLHAQTRDTQLDADFYHTCLKTLTEGLACSLGILFAISGEEHHPRVTLAQWHARNPDRFRDFIDMSANTDFFATKTVLGQSILSGETAWCSDIRDVSVFTRGKGIPHNGATSLIQLPIVIQGKVAFVFEFLKEGTSIDPAPERGTLDLVRLTIQNILNARISAEREREQLAMLVHSSKMSALGEIVAGVAHEVNNPLHSLKLTTTLMRRVVEQNSFEITLLREQLSLADKAIERMATLITELKAYSRESSCDTPHPCSLSTIVSDTLDLCRSRFESEGLKVIQPRIDPAWRVLCKPSEISQVLLNLLNNAFDATASLPQRWIALKVEQRDSSYQISVTDSGERIPEEIARKIMTPFFTTKPLGKGTGLGLSISANIISKHGGTLALDRECPNTRFVITLPSYQG